MNASSEKISSHCDISNAATYADFISTFLKAEKNWYPIWENEILCKIVQNRAKSCQNRAAKVKMIQKRASQGFLDPIQKRALSRSVQLEAVYLEALL